MLQGYCNCSNSLAKFLAKWRPRTSFMINKILTTIALWHRASPVGILQMSCAVSGVIFSTERRRDHSSPRRFPLSRCGEFIWEYHRRHFHGEKGRGGRGRKGEHNFIWLDDNKWISLSHVQGRAKLPFPSSEKVKAEVVVNSKNKIHQTWSTDFSRSLYTYDMAKIWPRRRRYALTVRLRQMS